MSRRAVLFLPCVCWTSAAGQRSARVPEQLNGGGVCLPNPPGCEENHCRVPSAEEVQPWLNVVCNFIDDPEIYEKACKRAKEAARIFEPEQTRRAVLAFFEGITM